MKQQLRLKLKKSLTLCLGWLSMGAFITGYDHLAKSDGICTALGVPYSFRLTLEYNLVGAFIGSIVAALVLVFYVNEKFRDKPYGRTMAVIVPTYCLAFFLIVVLMGALYLPKPAGAALPLKADLLRFLGHEVLIKNALIWSVITMLTQLSLQFNNKFGEGLLWSMITGRFQTPRKQERIFMLVDINSSTAIAEKLGDERYHNLLREFFADITDPILNNKGEIYQYVGDEVIIAWKRQEGVEKNRCVNCFFDIKRQMERLQFKYLEKYGLVPTFKAGLHAGTVTVGEVGILKRDITFSGDVLNTASRIQSKCKEFNVDFIASGEVVSQLQMAGNFIARLLGSLQLRGKEKEVELCSILPAA